jgi:hypothetical protein
MLGKDRTERQEQFILMVDDRLEETEIKAVQAGLRKLFYGSAGFVESMRKKYLRH